MMPSNLFDDSELQYIVLIDVPLRNENKKVTKQLSKKLNAFTKHKCDFRIVWKTKKVRQRFPLKEKKINVLHAKSVEEYVLVKIVIWVKLNEMLLVVGMSMKIQAEIQYQLNISFNTLIKFFNRNF